MEGDSLYRDSSHDFLPVWTAESCGFSYSIRYPKPIWLRTSSCMGVFRDRNLPFYSLNCSQTGRKDVLIYMYLYTERMPFCSKHVLNMWADTHCGQLLA